MPALNKIILIGRLTADPELRYTPNGAPVANFTLAVDRKFSKNDDTDFISIVAWRKLAEICNEFLHKGKLVAIEGRLQTRTYEDPNGNKRKAFDVVADEMQMLSGKHQGNVSSNRPAKKSEPIVHAGTQQVDLGIEDIPF